VHSSRHQLAASLLRLPNRPALAMPLFIRTLFLRDLRGAPGDGRPVPSSHRSSTSDELLVQSAAAAAAATAEAASLVAKHAARIHLPPPL